MTPPFERLEDRLLLTVTVSQKGSTLLVEFEDDGDNVQLTGTALRAITVTGATNGNDDYTGIKNIKITGGSSIDFVDLEDVQIAGGITAAMGAGDDDINFTGAATSIGGNVKIKMDAGDDDVRINANGAADPLLFAKNVTVDFGTAATSTGDSVLTFTDVDTGGTTIQGGFAIKGKDGVQNVNLSATTIEKNLKIDLGAGNDDAALQFTADPDRATRILKSATIRMGDGDDAVTFNVLSGGIIDIDKNLTVDLGNADTLGDTFVVVAQATGTELVNIDGNLTVKGKDGEQSLFIDGLAVGGNVKATLGDGNDWLDLQQNAGAINTTIGGNVTLSFGNGDDLFNIEQTTITGKAKIDGGNNDTPTGDIADLTANSNLTVAPGSSIKNFETQDLIT